MNAGHDWWKEGENFLTGLSKQIQDRLFVPFPQAMGSCNICIFYGERRVDRDDGVI